MIITPGRRRYQKGANCKLLIHSNTTNGSTTFTDSSGQGHAITPTGDAQHDTAQKRFGKTGIQFNWGSHYLTIGNHADFLFGANPFTVDAWIYLNDTTTERSYPIYQMYDQTTDNITMYVYINAGGDLQSYFRVRTTGEDVMVLGLTTIEASYSIAWHHIAFIRGWGGITNQFAVCYDGIAKDTTTVAHTMGNFADDLDIARVSGAAWNGWMDEIRVVKGTAMWTSNFTPPRRAYV
jgi:hypothetical protein